MTYLQRSWDKWREIIERDPARAMAEAQRLPSPRERCQHLAQIARFALDETSDRAFAASLAAAAEGSDEYQRTFVLAWPIRAAIECGRTSLAMSYLETALTQVPTIPQAGSRAYALGLLWQAAYPGGPAMQDAVWRTVLAGMPADRHWRAVVLYRDIAATRRYESDEAAQAIIATVPPGKARTKLENAARRRELMRPRPFFQARSARNSE